MARAPGVHLTYKPSGSQPIQGVGTAVAAFVGVAGQGPRTPTGITSWAQFQREYGETPVSGTYLHEAIYGFFENGGQRCFVVNVAGSDPDDSQTSGTPATGMLGSYEIRAVAPGPGGNDISVEVADASENPEEQFKITVTRDGQPLAEADNLKVTGSGNISRPPTELKELIEFDFKGDTATRPPSGAVQLQGGTTTTEIARKDFEGDATEREGVDGLGAYTEVNMVVAPDIWWAVEDGKLDRKSANLLINKIVSHCENMGNRMAIIDPPPDCRTAEKVKDWWLDLGVGTPFATLYWPWIEVASFAGRNGDRRLAPPSGHVAGIWSRTDGARGVHKAPANELVNGAIDIQFNAADVEQADLNQYGVNCIRDFPGRGIRVWGARTAEPDGEFRYVNVRRYFNYLQESILRGTQWVVFEPNDHTLWARIRRTITSFLVNEWRQGALFGQTPQEAFYVKCDGDINTAESIEAGEVHCEIGVAPVKPAEFVIFTLTQLPSGTSVVAE